MPPQTISGDRSPTPKMIYVGIVGGGNISETHARAAHETDGVEVAAIYGQNQEKTARLSQRFGGKVFTTLPAFLQHKPLDLVMIGSPSGLHAEQGIAAAQAGLHVLVEKPLDISTERADALISECVRAGGALINQGVHTVDLLLWLMGDVARVSALSITALHDIEVEDTVVATLEFANGAIGTLEAATSAYPGYPRRIELTGSRGTIILEHDRIVAADLLSGQVDLQQPTGQGSNPAATSPVVSDVTGHKELLKDFIGAIETNSRPNCDGVEGRRGVELVQAIYESARTGNAVTL
jgi:predicted dehydrogenase